MVIIVETGQLSLLPSSGREMRWRCAAAK